MKRAFVFAVVVSVALCAAVQAAPPQPVRNFGPARPPAASTASAGDNWMFRRSYYSHEPVQDVRIGRAVTGGPYYTRPTGGYVNAGWRWNRSTINVGGQVWDNTNIIESWAQTGGQF